MPVPPEKRAEQSGPSGAASRTPRIPDATTVTEILADYREQGFTASFSVVADGGVRCGVCRTVSKAETVTVNAMARAEGPSDPADMAMVAILTCPWCAMSGVLVAGFGPSSSVEDSDVLGRLRDDRPEGELAVLATESTPTQ